MSTGPDVSSYQPGISGAAVKAAGHSFLIVKATQGTGYVNPAAAAQVASARAAGLRVGLYHFLDGSNADAQAAFYLRVAAGLHRPGDLPLAFDFETNPGGGGQPTHTTLDRMRQVVRAAGYRTWTYTYPAWWAAQGAGGCASCGSDPLWLASYSSSAPAAPRPWTSWAMWQFTSSHRSVPGLTLDMNTTDRLDSLTGSSGDDVVTPADIEAVAQRTAQIVWNELLLPERAGIGPASAYGWLSHAAVMATQVPVGTTAVVIGEIAGLKATVAALAAAQAAEAAGAPIDLEAVRKAADEGAATAVERLLAASLQVTVTPAAPTPPVA